jgi:hypothetical protein
MPKLPATFETVRKLGLKMAQVEETTSYGSPALKVNGRMFVCMASHRLVEPNTLVVRMAFTDRDRRLTADPQLYYLQDHYVSYPSVLVRLPRCNQGILRDLLETAHAFVSSGTPVARRKLRGSARR